MRSKWDDHYSRTCTGSSEIKKLGYYKNRLTHRQNSLCPNKGTLRIDQDVSSLMNIEKPTNYELKPSLENVCDKSEKFLPNQKKNEKVRTLDGKRYK